MELLWMFVVLVCLALGLLILLFHGNNKRGAERKLLPLPPQPPSLPLIGHMHLFSKLPHQSLQLLSQKYGPLIRIRLGALRFVVASAPHVAREFLKSHDLRFAYRPQTIASSIISCNGQDVAFAPYGPLWQTLRKICTMELLSSKRIESFAAQRDEEVDNMLRSIREQYRRVGAVNVHDELWLLAYNNICRMVMSQKYTGATPAKVLKQTLEDAIRLLAEFHIGDFFPSLKWMDIGGLERRTRKTMGKLDEIFGEIIEERRRTQKFTYGSPSKDFLDVLLSHSEDGEEQYRLSDATIKAVILNMISGSTDSTTLSTEWALAELLRNPRVLKRAREELNSIVGTDRKVCEADIPRLPYLQAIVKETFRLHAPVPLLVPHFNHEDCEVAGYAIPAGTQVLINVWAIGRDPQVWERPLEFYPERFLGKDIEVKGMDFRMIPFGSGRRMCPGMALGVGLVDMGLASLIHTFEWRLQSGERPEEMDMTEDFKVTAPRAKHLIAVPMLRLPESLFN